MSWLQSYPDPKPEFEKAVRAPIGAVSPLWWAFAGVATAGVAYWWMTRWARPVNIEAAGVLPLEVAEPPALEEAAATYDLSPDAIEDVLDTPPFEEPMSDFTEALKAMGDDLTQLVGVGPKLALALADKGVKSFDQIADWTEDDLAFFDRELNLKGRAVREGWIDQAKTLAGRPLSPVALPE
jgi:predicted flap endonuclease-1-like 5' DNA nuclease